jgi:hypothetical protein
MEWILAVWHTLDVEKMKNTATAHDDKTTSGTIAEKVDRRESMPTLCGGISRHSAGYRIVEILTRTQRSRILRRTVFDKRRNKRHRGIR